MEDMDYEKQQISAISDDEELLLGEVIQGDAELYMLHHYLSEVFRPGDI